LAIQLLRLRSNTEGLEGLLKRGKARVQKLLTVGDSGFSVLAIIGAKVAPAPILEMLRQHILPLLLIGARADVRDLEFGTPLDRSARANDHEVAGEGP
jgi:hypothetical protein